MKIWSKLWLALCVTALVVSSAVLCWWGYEYSEYQKLPKFQNLTLELGQEMPELSAFFTEHADIRLARAITDLGSIDVSKVGTHTLRLTHEGIEEQVTLTVQDTTAPTATFRDVSVVTGTELKPEDFVVESYDLTGTVIAFAGDLVAPASYGDVTVEVIVTDANGNSTTGVCHVYYVWMFDSFTMELGDAVEKSDLLMDPENDADLLDQADLDAINTSGVGEYTVTSTDGSQSCSAVVTVVDTTPPVLELQEVSFYKGGTAVLEDFVVSATDLSGEVELTLVTELDFKTPGSQTVVIEARDAYGNVTTGETTMTIMTDTTPPVIYGMTNMTVEKNSSPNYMSDVYAFDSRDGYVNVTYNAGNVDITTMGTYYVTYTAVDSSGNKATAKRKVVVNHDAADTAAMVSEIASKLSSDPEAIRDYVRNRIKYNYSYGDGDPIWYGFTQNQGNCYVHAKCLQALLTEKGYTTQMIWVKDKSHYWLIIDLGGYWRHIDATPSTRHGKYSLMTDAQRYETLSGRDWDRSGWPACE